MATSEKFPRIHLDYHLKDTALDWDLEFYAASKEYVTHRPVQEQASVLFEPLENTVFMKLSRNVITIVRSMEALELEIEETKKGLVGKRRGDARDVINKSFFGSYSTGNLPDLE